jgi:hypothetical protein
MCATDSAKDLSNSESIHFIYISPVPSCDFLTNHQEPLIERVSEPRICTQNIEDNMVAGSPHLDFKDAMEAEHCKQAGCNEEFETINYRIQRRVSGAFEWAVNNGIFPA